MSRELSVMQRTEPDGSRSLWFFHPDVPGSVVCGGHATKAEADHVERAVLSYAHRSPPRLMTEAWIRKTHQGLTSTIRKQLPEWRRQLDQLSGVT